MEQDLSPEDQEFEFNMQANAVSRAVFLLGENKHSLYDIIRLLTDAERKAPYFCGFVDIDTDEPFKRGLEERLVKRGVVAKDQNGKLALTADGQRRSSVKLPEPIELNLIV